MANPSLVDQSHGKSLRRPIALIAFFALVMGAPIFFNPDGFLGEDRYRNADWLSIMLHRTHLYRSVHQFGEFPLWNPYIGGGYPSIQHPSDGSLSPFALPVLALGEVYGVKLNLLVLLFFGGFGVYLLARRRLSFSETGALFSAAAYMASGWFPSMMMVGFYNQAMFHLFPLIAYFLTGAFKNFRLVIPAGILYALYACVGASGFLTMGIFCSLLALWACLQKERGRFRFSLKPFGVLAVFFLIAASVASVKLVGIRDLARRGVYAHGQEQSRPLHEQVPRPDSFYRGSGEFLKALVFHAPKKAEYRDGRPVTLEYAYLGIPWFALLLFFAAFRHSPRTLAPWLFAGLFMLVLCFGPHSPINLYRWIILPIPPLRSISQFYKYANYFVFFVVTLISGAGLTVVMKAFPSEKGGTIFAAIAFAAFAPFVAIHASLLHETFKLDIPKLPPAKSFHQVRSDDHPALLEDPISHREMVRPASLVGFFNIQRGVGTIDWYADIYLPEYAAAKYLVHYKTGETRENPEYRGEAWFVESANRVLQVKVRSNTIEVEVEVAKLGVLVVNQNHHEGWRADRGKVLRQSGLLAVDLSAPGRYSVRLRFAPPGFYAWLAVSLLSLLICGVVWIVTASREQSPLHTP